MVAFNYHGCYDKNWEGRDWVWNEIKINAGQFTSKNTKSFDAALVGIKNRFKI